MFPEDEWIKVLLQMIESLSQMVESHVQKNERIKDLVRKNKDLKDQLNQVMSWVHPYSNDGMSVCDYYSLPDEPDDSDNF